MYTNFNVELKYKPYNLFLKIRLCVKRICVDKETVKIDCEVQQKDA